MTRIGFLLAAALLTACASAPPHGERLLTQAETRLAQGDHAGASDAFREALAHYQMLNDEAAIVRSGLGLAGAALLAGRLQAADDRLQAICQQAEIIEPERLRLLQSSLALQRGYYEQARLFLEPVLTSPTRSDALYRALLAKRIEVALAAEADDVDDWLTRYAQAVGERRDQSAVRLHRFRAERARRAGDAETARRELLEAHRLEKSLPAALQRHSR